jgi:ribosomal protein L37AE/L43A
MGKDNFKTSPLNYALKISSGRLSDLECSRKRRKTMDHNWMRIDDRIPVSNKKFIAVWDDGDIGIAEWRNYYDGTSLKESFHKYYECRAHKILYWQPLPKLPSGFKVESSVEEYEPPCKYECVRCGTTESVNYIEEKDVWLCKRCSAVMNYSLGVKPYSSTEQDVLDAAEIMEKRVSWEQKDSDPMQDLLSAHEWVRKELGAKPTVPGPVAIDDYTYWPHENGNLIDELNYFQKLEPPFFCCSKCKNEIKDNKYAIIDNEYFCNSCYNHGMKIGGPLLAEFLNSSTSNMTSINGVELKEDEKLVRLRCVNCEQVKLYKINKDRQIGTIKCGDLGYDHDEDVFKFCGFNILVEVGDKIG